MANIKKLVVAKIKTKIANAQKRYDDGCIKIDDEAKKKKSELETKLVDEIVN